MYIKLKKVVVIFIFLISIIGMLMFENYNLRQDFYNILVISNENDLTKESYTQMLWDDLANLSSENEGFHSKSIDYKYLEVKKSDTFKTVIDENYKTNDLFIIMGDTYNDIIKDVMQNYPDVKFLLVENSLDLKGDNIYNININWQDIYLQIKTYLVEEKTRLKKEKKIDDKEKFNVYAFDNNIDRLNELKEEINSDEINLQTLFYDSTTKEDFLDIYNTQDEIYIINLGFENQTETITKFLKIQKENMYDYYESITNKKALEYSQQQNNNQTDEDEQDDDNQIQNNQKEKTLKYIPIHYIGLYSGDTSIGVYDNVLDDDIVQENILVFDFGLDFKKAISDIILLDDAPKSYELKLEDSTLKFDIIK